MKNKNRPRRTKPKPKKPTRQKKFNPWVAKYFDLSGTGIERCKDEQLDERTIMPIGQIAVKANGFFLVFG